MNRPRPAVVTIVALACAAGLPARTSAKPSEKGCRYEIVKAPYLRQFKPLPKAPFSDPQDVTFAGQTFLALYADDATDRWHLVGWDSPTKKPRVLATQKGSSFPLLATAPDGHRVAFITSGEEARSVVVYDVASGALTTVASEKYAAHFIPADPIWDPTGKYLAVSLSGFVGARILPRRVRVYEVASGKRIRDTPPSLDVEAELWDRDGLLVRRTMESRGDDYDDQIYSYSFWRLASLTAEPKELSSVPLRSPDGRISLERARRHVQIRDGESACLLKLDVGKSEWRPTDITWLSRDRLLLPDKDGGTWMVDVRARRAQPLAADSGVVRFDGHILVVGQKDGSFGTASID